MDPQRRLSILQISTADVAGGAEKIARDLFQAYRARGHRSRLVVGFKGGRDPDVAVVPNAAASRGPARWVWAAEARLQPYYGRVKGVGRLGRWLRRLAQPASVWDELRGREVFRYPGTFGLLDREAGFTPDLLHAHNLHGDYFDLGALPVLSRRAPVVLTLHDAWLLSGHCAHSFECERWRTGCGQCPDLRIPPAIRRDATAENWRRKHAIFVNSRLYVSAPSRWLRDKIGQSMLAEAAEVRVIPNGVDLSVYRPVDRRQARAELGLPPEAAVLVMAANSLRRNPWKDYPTLRAALVRVAAAYTERPVVCLALGERAPAEPVGPAEIRFIPYEAEPAAVARYYQAADLYLHAALADTFPNTVLEALACGLPVVATAVGGIPEQVEDGATGGLVPRRDAAALAARVVEFLSDDARRTQMGQQAAATARRRFDLIRQVDDYLNWYNAVIADWRTWREASHAVTQ